MKGNGGIQLAQFNFPFLSILWSLFYHTKKFTVSLISLSSVDLFVFFPNELNYCWQQMWGHIKGVLLLKTSFNQYYKGRVLLEYNITVSASAQETSFYGLLFFHLGGCLVYIKNEVQYLQYFFRLQRSTKNKSNTKQSF